MAFSIWHSDESSPPMAREVAATPLQTYFFFFHADGSERENFDFRKMLARQTFSSIMAYFCANKFRKIIFN
jgi:hypothetical protein